MYVMEKLLISALKYLPEVERCCFCIKNLRCASVPCAMLTFPLSLSTIHLHFYTIRYHHKPEVFPIVLGIISYARTLSALVVFITNIQVLFLFCTKLSKKWGYLFVLSILLMQFLDSVWSILAFVRAVVGEPGIFCKESEVAEETLIHSKKRHKYCQDMFILVNMIVNIFSLYPIIVIYSWLRSRPRPCDDDMEGDDYSLASTYASNEPSRESSVASRDIEVSRTASATSRHIEPSKAPSVASIHNEPRRANSRMKNNEVERKERHKRSKRNRDLA